MKEQVLQNGGKIINIDYQVIEPGYKGMVATEDIAQGDIIVFVPQSLLITRDVVSESKTFQSLKDQNVVEKLQKPDSLEFSVYLMEQKREPDSIWKHYLGLWPTSYATFPMFYTNEEMAWLEGSWAQRMNSVFRSQL